MTPRSAACIRPSFPRVRRGIPGGGGQEVAVMGIEDMLAF